MRIVLVLLCAILLFLQYCLWGTNNGILTALDLKRMIKEQQAKNNDIIYQNDILTDEINMLKNNKESIENKARNDLGMIKTGETFYQIIK